MQYDIRTAPPSSLSASQDLDRDEPLPPSSSLDDSLGVRKQATVTSLTQRGSMAAFPVVLSEGEGGGFKWVVGEAQGRRKNMEDAHVVNLDIDGNGTALFALFDGHSGPEVAAFCAQHIAQEVVVSAAFSRGDLAGALQEAFLALDSRVQSADSRGELAGYAEGNTSAKKYGITNEHGHYRGPKAGSTAAVALVRGAQLFVAHAGDSRVVLSEGGVALALTEDHKPDVPGERDRIYKAGQFVRQRPGGVPRVGGSLAMSRAIGDVRFKDPRLAPDQQAVTAAPDTTAVRLGARSQQQQDPASSSSSSSSKLYPAGAPDEAGGAPQPHPRLLVVACDGVWDVMSRQMVINFLQLQLAQAARVGVSGVAALRSAVSALLHEALRHDSTSAPTSDNVTAVVVQLPPPPPATAT